VLAGSLEPKVQVGAPLLFKAFRFPDMHTRAREGSRDVIVGSATFCQSRTQQGPSGYSYNSKDFIIRFGMASGRANHAASRYQPGSVDRFPITAGRCRRLYCKLELSPYPSLAKKRAKSSFPEGLGISVAFRTLCGSSPRNGSAPSPDIQAAKITQKSATEPF
jgi:hypothetical protein